MKLSGFQATSEDWDLSDALLKSMVLIVLTKRLINCLPRWSPTSAWVVIAGLGLRKQPTTWSASTPPPKIENFPDNHPLIVLLEQDLLYLMA